ncbi:MAG: type II toxin-antitoxin system PemK/MazF family toxin [Promethearchaeota archaeon]
MKQGEIWLVKFSNSVGHEYKKERPALIIEADSQIRKSAVFTIIPLTSNSNNKIKDDILIARDNQNRLFCDSILKVHHIQSFDKSRFTKRIGVVKKDIFEQVKNYLKIHFNL